MSPLKPNETRSVRARSILTPASGYLCAFTHTLNFSRKHKVSMRLAALALGLKRVHDAKRARGLFPLWAPNPTVW